MCFSVTTGRCVNTLQPPNIPTTVENLDALGMRVCWSEPSAHEVLLGGVEVGTCLFPFQVQVNQN